MFNERTYPAYLPAISTHLARTVLQPRVQEYEPDFHTIAVLMRRMHIDAFSISVNTMGGIERGTISGNTPCYLFVKNWFEKMHKSILNKVAPVIECIARCSVFLAGRLIVLSIKPTDRGLSALIGSLILSLLLVNTMAAHAEVDQSPAPIRGVHCDFERVNKFSKFNKIRLAIMSADGIVVHSDLAGRYNASRALVTGTVSYMVSIDVNGKILSMRLADSSGNEKNDAIAARLIRAVSPLKTEPPYEGALKILFQNDGDMVKVLPMSSPTVSGAIKSCVPPFPVLVPLNQQDYERGLSPEDAGWIQRTSAEIMHQLNNRNLNVVGTRCLMEISSAGIIVAPVYFSSPRPEERQMVKFDSVK